MIRCTKCGEFKSSEDFAKDDRNRSGFSSWCKACYNKKSREYKKRPDYPGKKRSYDNRFYKKNHDQIRADQKGSRLQSRYGITIEEFDAMSEAQDGKCKICGETPERTLHVDHNHLTGKVRGLLCNRCNLKLGTLENEDWCRKANEYRRNHG